MLVALTLWIKNAVGWIVGHPRLVFTILAGIVLLVAVIVVFKSCGKTPKLNEQEIQAAQEAIKTRNDAELKRILVESDVREKQIDANVSNAAAETVNAIAESKKKYENMNTSDLAAELERRK